jgi:hypothetical protein
MHETLMSDMYERNHALNSHIAKKCELSDARYLPFSKMGFKQIHKAHF